MTDRAPTHPFPVPEVIIRIRESMAHYKNSPPYSLRASLEMAENEEARRKALLAQKYWDYINEKGHMKDFMLWALERDNAASEIIDLVRSAFDDANR